jgi:hypothetical protein
MVERTVTLKKVAVLDKALNKKFPGADRSSLELTIDAAITVLSFDEAGVESSRGPVRWSTEPIKLTQNTSYGEMLVPYRAQSFDASGDRARPVLTFWVNVNGQEIRSGDIKMCSFVKMDDEPRTVGDCKIWFDFGECSETRDEAKDEQLDFACNRQFDDGF